MAAPRALASLTAAGPTGPCCSASVAMMTVTIRAPKAEHTTARVRVAHSACAPKKPSVPVAMPVSPTQTATARPNRRITHGASSPHTTAPTANEVLCSAATPRLVCCSSRSSGTTGPKP
jgi:hypothetical protein